MATYFAVYSFYKSNDISEGTTLVSLHETLELARQWAKYYCQKEYGNYYVCKQEEQDANGLEEHEFDVSYQSDGSSGLGYFAEMKPIQPKSEPPPRIEYYWSLPSEATGGEEMLSEATASCLDTDTDTDTDTDKEEDSNP